MVTEKPQTPKAAMFSKPPKNQRNIEKRSREYLSNNEIDALRKAARTQGRNTVRDDALILLMFRHALRVSEVVTLRWEQVDLKESLLHVRRLKNGTPSTHPLRGVELRLLRQLECESAGSSYVFNSERKTPLSARAVHNIVARAGVRADFDFTVHPHMLRHSTGFYLANKGEDTRAIQLYMGHANIKNTVIYTSWKPKREITNN